MILSAVHICYDPSHQPFASEGAVKIEDLHSERPASKIIRAVIRYNGIDATSWESYSLHKCYCNSRTKTEDQHREAFKSELNLEELGIRDGDSVFIRKTDYRVDEMEEDQGSNSRRPSRKRKERADSTSRKRKSTSHPPKAPAAVDKVSSNLENLTSNAAAIARSISKLLGGGGWKSQSIGDLGLIQTRSPQSLQGLLRLAKTSQENPPLSRSDRSGLFNSDLVEALTRAYHQRTSSCSGRSVDHHFWVLGLSDYEQANELLKGKIKKNGSWEGSSLAHLDESALSKPVHRFPLSDSGLTGHSLSTARDICTCWNNDKWINQAPLPGLSPISLKRTTNNATLRQIAELTGVKPGEATPDGFPPIVLRALRQAIKQRTSRSKPGSKFGWSQSKDIAQALEILKGDLKDEEMARSTSSASTSVNKKAKKSLK